ncbi:MAG: hypothetical protein J6K85_01790 [Clostridia bacterium]|nr:hypothetical protein [Clostridia bacterium]
MNATIKHIVNAIGFTRPSIIFSIPLNTGLSFSLCIARIRKNPLSTKKQSTASSATVNLE